MAIGDKYRALHARSLQDPEGFWAEQAAAIDWTKRWDKVLDGTKPPFYRWFEGGELNACHNALDRHVDGASGTNRAEQAALIYDSPLTNTKKTFTYRELRDQVARVAGMIAAQGVGKGDRVILYMPMIPEAVMAMLACARLGAIHSVVFGGFAAKELSSRIDDCGPKLILTASCGIEPSRIVQYKPLVDQAIEQATHKVPRVILLQRPQCAATMVAGRDLDWNEALATAQPAPCVPVKATDPLYILYTSGTTGQPKGVVRDTGGYCVALAWSMKNLYGVEPGEVYWCASDVGWVVGHSYIVYGPLIHGATSILYEGKPVGTPDAGAFWRVISEHKAMALFTAPTAFRAIKREDPEGKLLGLYDLSNFRTLFLAGERGDPPTVEWAQKLLGVPVVDHWWQTETGWAICGNFQGLDPMPVKLGSTSVPSPGWHLDVLDENGHPMKPGEVGALAGKLPLPPGTFPTLWNADERYRQSYMSEFPGYYKTGDAGFIDPDGYVSVMTRVDDVINVAGHRLSTGQIEEVLGAHNDVAECAVIGIADDLKGQVPLGFLVLKAGVNRPPQEITNEVVQMVRDRIGPVAFFKSALVVQRLPKTRSGKILRGTMQKMADSQPWTPPATIEDPVVLEEIKDGLKTAGFAAKN
ncbi:propionyl-CoA synthetase [Reyranella sp.]|uniref:propionyl-CoA synthetase n=1 Tax=Reyranella sp. TaxID=1929291 RepID=UPI000BC3E41E|nr:propionyl-CoA synthetase [Reyranella sp.]OYY42110.1 MAG: propionyl-CoA synthetase [Rhodospirillales bacterium 35-66-84]OYZ93891.1 MAG: propionyl-CoA synthetase [Rhodospirillales bacterium 24-66-33]OZB25142.1 MAG: propionyl-CoA synthetase [Rhodospirillales bacterium 39-66-50]HQS17959.1 propionyl-CoA synthetase [Reyranella sp.]HQT10604.1 propionyl-CoA synthetase [Reyranella sp.]